ncbi:MAG: hypothetical protein AAB091_04625 [Elusimicrobiota bacterium]
MRSKFKVFILAALAVWYIFQARSAINRLSPTYDEPFHLAAGYVMLHNRDYRYQGLWHPPLAEMLAAAPLKFFSESHRPILQTVHPAYSRGRNYEFADFFLYQNRADPERMLRAGRWAIFLFFGPLLIVSLWFLSGLLSSGAAFWSFILLALEPNLLAHATLVTTDYASAVMTLAVFAAACFYFKHPSRLGAVGFGLALALGLLSKYTNGMGLAPLVLFFALERKRFLAHAAWRAHAAWAALAFAVVFFVVYQGSSPGIYADGFRNLFKQVERGRSSFFWGRHSNQGWLFYFPAALLLKTNLPVLAAGLAGAALALIAYRKTRETYLLMALILPATSLAMASFSKVQIGLRYALSFYPFLILLGGWALAWIEGRRSPWRWLAAPALLFGFLSVERSSPWFLAYFNEFAGGPSGGWRYFTDSNNDWGQGLGELARHVKSQGVDCLYLSYFGTGDPNYYGLKYVPVGMVSNAQRTGNSECRPEREKKIYFAVSSTNYQATYFADRKIFAWLRPLEAEVFLAGSIFLYDLAREPQARQKLAALLELEGRHEQAQGLMAAPY